MSPCAAELGDYSESEHSSGYLSEFCFIPAPPQDFHKEVAKHHQQHRYTGVELFDLVVSFFKILSFFFYQHRCEVRLKLKLNWSNTCSVRFNDNLKLINTFMKCLFSFQFGQNLNVLSYININN